MVAAAEDPVPTVLGLLVLGHRPTDFIPGASILFLRIDGEELSDAIIDAAEIDGAVGRMVRVLDDKMNSHNRVRVDITSGRIEKRIYDYPLIALQQLTRTAVMHRTYEGTNAPP
ncbi:MAG: hypothetical protein HQK58_12940 [Deltaproteobacteria bacterium]|nr:hypothetical protein [Deltaproteobacteria bacterium]